MTASMIANRLLTVEELDVHYGRRSAVSGVSFHIEAGTVTSIVGPNGAGKSSLLNAIGGLVAPSGGRVDLAGENITGRPSESTYRKGLALVPEGKRVFTSLTVEENMRVAAAAFGSSGAARIPKCLELFPRLQSRYKQKASSLSGGEQQQLMIARSLVGEPSVLLLDEPSLGLAPLIVREVFSIIERLARSGVGVLLVEQFVHDAVSISSRIHVLSRGKLVQSYTGVEARATIKAGGFFEAYSGRV